MDKKFSPLVLNAKERTCVSKWCELAGRWVPAYQLSGPNEALPAHIYYSAPHLHHWNSVEPVAHHWLELVVEGELGNEYTAKHRQWWAQQVTRGLLGGECVVMVWKTREQLAGFTDKLGYPVTADMNEDDKGAWLVYSVPNRVATQSIHKKL